MQEFSSGRLLRTGIKNIHSNHNICVFLSWVIVEHRYILLFLLYGTLNISF